MSKTVPYVRDLRMTAATVVANHIRATWSGSGEAVPYAVVEAGLALASPFLVDAFVIEEAMAGVDEEVRNHPHRHLEQLERSGKLCLRTLSGKALALDCEGASA
ncbi:hypothetical protein RB614_00875 [Phytohabitans sp. ZYX-F-186]|uniref:DUF5753 domain-containing protein n=1 Tax=Phytohabitans maris TaxID=3071409 RepID=A0ABU0Z7P2_9ACTN|nr:hypothetical protein [Phytohabitans sp. ZYX-F-186]MDQ7903073.1 hypothetical protein [Phytohabitans sp. ZYX-F-186]